MLESFVQYLGRFSDFVQLVSVGIETQVTTDQISQQTIWPNENGVYSQATAKIA